MKRKYLVRIPLILIALIIPLLIWPGIILSPSSLMDESEVQLPGLRQPVTVNYDAWGMPHVLAENEHDLFYAAGYLMASERLFQMDMVNRAMQGRLSEMSPGLLNTDKYLRTWGFDYIAQQMVEVRDDALLADVVAAADHETPAARRVPKLVRQAIHAGIRRTEGRCLTRLLRDPSRKMGQGGGDLVRRQQDAFVGVAARERET